MGNTHVKPRPRTRNKKQVHWKAADRPLPPGKPYLVPQTDSTPEFVTIRWTKPVSDGGSPITGYLVEHKRTGSPHWVRATPLLVPFPELTLSGLEPGWRYQFRISAENAVGMSDPGELSEPLTVTLQRSAITAPRFTEELVDKTVLENDKAEFIVHFLGQPPPKVCWFKDGFEIFSSRRTRILTENDRSVLTIHQTALTDEGEIKCTATNRAGHASTKAKLTVEAPPSIRLPRNYEDGLLFELGETIRLKVSIAGRPAPLVFWSHDGETVQNDERHEIEHGDRFSFLKINEATRQDRGEYQIKAVNKIGEDHTSFLVTITDKPSPPGKARVVMTLGRSVTLTWSTPEDDGGCKIGNYVIEYYRLGWNVWLKAATTRQLTTILGDLIEGSEYKFRVKAESPYGMSEPSEESEVIFIPDPKRGIITPAIRSRSQPRDIFEDETIFGSTPRRSPVRKTKPEPRSQSSSRAERSHNFANVHFAERDDVIPIRPERTKIKSPPKTPEASPNPIRKTFNDQSMVNNRIFDSASIARDLAYGSPNLVPPRSKSSINREAKHQPFENDRPLTPPNNAATQLTLSPTASRRVVTSDEEQTKNSSNVSSPVDSRKVVPTLKEEALANKQESSLFASPKTHRKNEAITDNNAKSSERREKSPSPIKVSPRRDKSPSPISPKEKEHFGGSSEFMLVLYPDEHKGLGSASDIRLTEEDDGSVAPPMSLSAPELGATVLQVEILKRWASSTELLHERAMERFYQSALAEEEELEKARQSKTNNDRKLSVDIPKIQINSKDDEDIVGLERKHSLKRRLSGGGAVPSGNILWAQRRRSIKLSSDLSDLMDSNMQKEKLTAQEKRNLMLTRERSASEELEEQEFERVREKMKLEKQNSSERRSIEIVDEEKWDVESNEEGEYEESISEEDTESSADERLKDLPAPKPRFEEDEEEEPYHPGILRNVGHSIRSDAPFEILTKPNPLPDPNFVPKPILKKRDYDEPLIRPPSAPILKRKEPTFRGMEEKDAVDLMQRNRSLSLTEGEEHYVPRQRSFSLVPQPSGTVSPPPAKRGSISTSNSQVIKAAAEISSFAAAGVVIPEPLWNKKKAEEEARVVADHYGDIVRSYGQKKNNSSQIYTDRDLLKKAAEFQENFAAELSETESAAQATPLDDRSISSSKEEVPQAKQASINFTIHKEDQSAPSQSEEYIRQRKSSLSQFVAKRRENRASSQSPHRFRQSQSRTPSKSPARKESREEFKNRRNFGNSSSPSPEPSRSRPKKQRTPSSSLSPTRKPKPYLREIMTQTSVGLDTHPSDKDSQTSSKPEQVVVVAKVRTFMDYTTDLAVLAVACWLYLFSNELFALPVLLVLVYRQLKDELKRRLPEWLPKKYKDKKN